ARDDARRPARSALSALPPGGGAVHAADARGPAVRLQPDSGAAWPHRRGSRATAARQRRAGRPARPVLTSRSPAETERIAAELAATLRVGDVVTVSGELGSGKTTFVRGACRALGVEQVVTSP